MLLLREQITVWGFKDEAQDEESQWEKQQVRGTTTSAKQIHPPQAYRNSMESCRHVGYMSARQPKVSTFGRLGQVVPTKICSQHFFCVGVCRLSPNQWATTATTDGEDDDHGDGATGNGMT